MKILVITRSAWDDSNSIGNTMTNFFSGYNKNDIANLYFRSAMPNNNVCKKYYSISDKDIFKSIFSIKGKAGKAFNCDCYNNKYSIYPSKDSVKEEKLYSFFRKKTSVLAFWVQDILWRLGKWKNSNLDQFLDEFEPDVIFSPSFHTSYTHRVLWYVKKKTNAKVALFHADDYLSINSKGISFLETINQKKRAKIVEQSALKADINYCISKLQQEEYQKRLGKDMSILYKGAEFLTQPEYSLPKEGEPIKIIYIGSILYGRWKTLALLTNEISKINKGENIFQLIIYSQYTLNKEMKDGIIVEGASFFKGKIAPTKINDILSSGDIVLHIESFDQIEKLKTKLSFSTKIVDCLNSGRALMAIGWDESASIRYLLDNNAALVATNEFEVRKLLNEVIREKELLKKYALNGWLCGKLNHQVENIRENLMQELKSLKKEN